MRVGPVLPVLVVSGLLCLGIANISARATWHAVEDGVLWTTQPEGVVAADVAADTPAAAEGIKRGDLLLAIDDRPVQEMSDVVEMLRAEEAGQTVRYTILRLGTREVVDVRIAPIPSGARALYSCLRPSAFSRCSSAARCGCGVHATLRRCTSSGWPSPSRRLHVLVQRPPRSARLGLLLGRRGLDAPAAAALPAFHARLPRTGAPVDGRFGGPRDRALVYVPAALLGVAHVVAFARSSADAGRFVRVLETLDRLELLYLAGCLIAGLAASPAR